MVDEEKLASVVTTGASVTEAIAEGLARLELELDEVDVEVLAEPTRGLFGLGSREAEVRVSIKAPVDESAPPEEPVEEPKPVPVRRKPRPAPSPPPPKPEPVARPVSAEGPAETVRGVVEELLALMGFDDARIDVRQAEPAEGESDAPLLIDISVRGDALIGPRGETLNALQYITRLITGREQTERKRIVLDVNGYKVKREEKLRGLAQRLAQQAVDTERTVVLEPMSPFERRIVHMSLRDHPDVTTQSIGEGSRRKVTIIPKFE